MMQARSEVRELLDRHGLRPAKALGQHFLVDPNITRRIVGLSRVGPGDHVVEIGAGTGTLTRALADSGAVVVAYEVDPRLEALLDEVLEGTTVDLRIADVTSVDLVSELDATRRWTMVANLPYNVGTRVVLDALRHTPRIESFVVMLQTEVAERLVAAPGVEAYGLPSVVVGLHGRARREFTVPPQVFLPPPRVGSSVVSIVRTPSSIHAERAIRLAAAGFGKRRKMLRSSLASVLDDPSSSLESAGVLPTARAEELAAADWLRLAEAWP